MLRPASEILIRINEVMSVYKKGLEKYTNAQFEYKHDAETWSLAEMYEHVMSSSQKFFLANTKRCIVKRNGQEGGEMNEKGKQLFTLGEFPNIKIKVPKAVEVVMVTREISDYKTDIDSILKSAMALEKAVMNDEGNYKIAHPVFDFLNAHEWYMQFEMHSRHHLRQKDNLEALANA